MINEACPLPFLAKLFHIAFVDHSRTTFSSEKEAAHMTGLIITVSAIGLIILCSYFMTKWEKVVFPGNQKNGPSDTDQQLSDKKSK
jgi:hypothetical protein